MSLFTINSIYRGNREANNISTRNYTFVDNPLNTLDNVVPEPENREISPYVHQIEATLNDIVNDISQIDRYNNMTLDQCIDTLDSSEISNTSSEEEPIEDEDSELCPICLEKIDLNTNEFYRVFVIDTCEHKYHYKCLVNWRKHEGACVDFKRVKRIKCELCQTYRSYALVKNYTKIKSSNRYKCTIM